MAIEYKDDPRRGAGYGILEFSGVLVPAGPWQISLQRGKDHKFATGRGATGWVGEAFLIAAKGEPKADGGFDVFLEPGLVDALDPQEIYRVTLKGADGDPVSGRLKVGAVTYSGNAALGVGAPLEEAPREVEEPPAPQTSLRPDEAGEPETIAMPTVQPKAVSHFWRYAIIGLLILACALWFWLDPRKNAAPPEQAPRAEQAPEAQRAPEKRALSPAEQVSAFFAGDDRTARKAMRLAEELPKVSDQDKDAIYRLIYYAAGNGDGEAMLAYGACLDPSQPTWGSIEKDALLAWAEYGKAQNAGVAAASGARDNLRKWLEEQSGQGNAKARRWLADINRQ